MQLKRYFMQIFEDEWNVFRYYPIIRLSSCERIKERMRPKELWKIKCSKLTWDIIQVPRGNVYFSFSSTRSPIARAAAIVKSLFAWYAERIDEKRKGGWRGRRGPGCVEGKQRQWHGNFEFILSLQSLQDIFISSFEQGNKIKKEERQREI